MTQYAVVLVKMEATGRSASVGASLHLRYTEIITIGARTVRKARSDRSINMVGWHMN
jgi:hypothetical protein